MVVSFNDICLVFDKLRSSTGTNSKKEVFRRYLLDWRKKVGPDCYDAMRLFLPKLDEREYGLKEDTIAQRLIKALAINPTSTDALDLKNWRIPSKTNAVSGDFPNVAFEKIKVRSIVNRNTQTVQQTNELLDELANDRNMDNQIKLFRRILNNYTSYEIKWLLRIIIKGKKTKINGLKMIFLFPDLKMGMTENSIFNVFHPYAKSAFDGGKSLKEICYEFSNTSQATHTEIQLFAPCLPQRGFRGTTIEIRRFIADVPKPFYVEQKVDGVRFLLHCDKEKDKFMWFTRNRNNETEKYGASSADMSKLSGHVSNGILAESVILDGEMVAYDPSSDILLPFGTLNTSSRNDITDDSQPHPCFIVFDILWFSGKPLIHHSLQNRLLLLDKYIKNQGNYMRLLPRKPMNTEEEVYTELNYIIEKRMEGLILKNPLSPYRLASKDRAWIKLKPDYMDSLIDTSDLLVVGAKYGEGRRGSKLARLLCAVRDDRVESDEPRFITFVMAAGMKDEEIEELKGMIKIKCPFDSGKIPRWLIHPSRPKHYPDVLIDYTNSIVVEVKATEIVPSSNVGVESTLRFPRIIRLRKDKGWQDVMTLSDVNEAKENGKVAIRRNDREQGEVKAPPAKKQRVATHRSFTLLSSQQGAGSIHEESKTNIFQGIMFYIMEGTHLLSKKELERLVMENGGTCVQNQRKARYIVASNADTVRVQILIRTGKYNIVLPQFVIDCIQEKDLIDISPKYMLFTTQETQKQLLNDFDMWGDSYTKTTSAKELSNLLSTIKSESTEDDQRKICQSISEIYFDGSLPGMIFIRVVAYIDLNNTSIEYPIHMTMPWVQQKKAYDELAIASSLLLSEGAVVVTRASNDVTHVILNANDLTRLSSLTQVFNRIPLPRFVTSKWVDACISNQCLISEHDYEPRVNTS